MRRVSASRSTRAGNRHAGDGGDHVPVPEPGPGVRRTGHDRIHHERDGQVEHPRGIQHLADAALVDVQFDRVALAEDRRLADVPPGQVGLQHAEILRDIVVEGEDPVAVAEAHVIGQLIDIDAVPLVLDVGAAPDVHDGDIQQDRQDEIEQDPARHHQEPLPGRLRAELPGLGLPFQGFQVHRLVHHPADLAVPAERRPADAVLGLPLRRLREQADEPGRPGREQLHPAEIEEEEELVHPDAEELGKGEMAELMDEDEHGKGQDDLECLDERYHRRILSWARAKTASCVAKMPSRSGSAVNSTSRMHSATRSEMS